MIRLGVYRLYKTKLKETRAMDIRKFFKVKEQSMQNVPVKEITKQFSELNNKGTGAGGAKTNENGKRFEENTSNEMRLISQGFEKINLNKNKYGYYLSKKTEKYEIVFVLQKGFVMFIKERYNIEMTRHPDEAYIIIPNEGKATIKILEKKNQNVEGSVQDKLWTGPTFKMEYSLFLGENFEVEYAYCLSNWFKSKFENNEKYKKLNIILSSNNIKLFYGEDTDYYENLDKWISL